MSNRVKRIAKKLKITHVNLARGFRGGERQTFNLMAGLCELGVVQTIIGRNGSELIRRCGELNVQRVEISHPILGHLRVPTCDLIHVHEARGAYWALIEHATRKTPYIITRRIPNPIGTSILTRHVYDNAVTLLGVSQDVSQRLARQTGRSVKTVLSGTTFHTVIAEKVIKIRQELGGAPIIGHIGALQDHHKGQSVLIEAFHKLLADFPHARLVLVGEGPDRMRFERLANGDSRIRFVGFQEDVGSWIAALDLLAFPSREEGLGSSVLDAMALSVPVVASAVGGLPELIGQDERGLTVTDHSPDSWYCTMKKMLREDSMRRRVVHAARQFAWNNGANSMTDQYMTLYTNILLAHEGLLSKCRARKARCSRPNMHSLFVKHFNTAHSKMEIDVKFTVRNYVETLVFDKIKSRQDIVERGDDFANDVAGMALNKVKPHYVREKIYLFYYSGDAEWEEMNREVADAVEFAFNYVKAHVTHA